MVRSRSDGCTSINYPCWHVQYSQDCSNDDSTLNWHYGSFTIASWLLKLEAGDTEYGKDRRMSILSCSQRCSYTHCTTLVPRAQLNCLYTWTKQYAPCTKMDALIAANTSNSRILLRQWTSYHYTMVTVVRSDILCIYIVYRISSVQHYWMLTGTNEWLIATKYLSNNNDIPFVHYYHTCTQSCNAIEWLRTDIENYTLSRSISHDSFKRMEIFELSIQTLLFLTFLTPHKRNDFHGIVQFWNYLASPHAHVDNSGPTGVYR